jgi:hypothetical protein
MASVANTDSYTQSSSQEEVQFTLPTPVTTEGRYIVAVYNGSTETELEAIVYIHADGEEGEDRAEVARFDVHEYGLQNGVARQVLGLGLYDTTYWVKTVAKSSFTFPFGVTVKVFNAG